MNPYPADVPAALVLFGLAALVTLLALVALLRGWK